jgi:signal transduction histidine kinase/ActR/RegA family two-component response regulator
VDARPTHTTLDSGAPITEALSQLPCAVLEWDGVALRGNAAARELVSGLLPSTLAGWCAAAHGDAREVRTFAAASYGIPGQVTVGTGRNRQFFDVVAAPGLNRCVFLLIDRTVEARLAAVWRTLYADSTEPQCFVGPGGILDCNAAFARRVGAAGIDDVIGRRPAEFAPALQPDGSSSRAMAVASEAEVMSRGSSRMLFQHHTLQGEPFTVEVTAVRHDPDGVDTIHAVWRDLTEVHTQRDLLEAQLRTMGCQERILHTLLGMSQPQDSALAVVATEINYALGGSGCEVRMLCGDHTLAVGRAGEITRRDALEQVVPVEDDWRVELRIERGVSPERHELESTFLSTVCHALATATRQIRSAREVLRARDLAMAAVRSNDAMLAAISHEIRNPLGTLLGMVSLLHPKSSSERELVGQMGGVGRQLVAMVDDLLDFGRAGSGHMPVRPEPVDVRRLLADMVAESGPAAAARGLELRLIAPAGAEWRVIDPIRVRQIVYNLVMNALKFTARGRVDVQLDAEPGWVCVRVRDTGVGVRADQIERIFEPFAQLGSEARASERGAGLGLAILKRVVDAMDGRVAVESVEGVGSEFTVSLPAAEAEPPRAADPEPADAHVARRVLVVDDDPVSRRVSMMMVERMGASVDGAEHPEQALAWIGEGRRWDVVLLDVWLPGMDGFALAARIGERHTPPPRLVALTGDAETSTMRRCLDAGIDEVLTKPVDAGRLRRALLAEVAQHRQAAALSG